MMQMRSWNRGSAITHWACRLSVLLPLTLGVARTASAQADEDLTRALAGDGRRKITDEPRREQLAWRRIGNDPAVSTPILKVPFAACWHGGRLAVADRTLNQVVVLTQGGAVARTLGSRGAAPGQFAELTVVRCAPGAAAFMTADLGLHRVTFFDTAGTVLRTARLPEVPQIDILGEFALARDGSWFESWLGSDVTFGPYLSDTQWGRVGLVRRYGPNDAPAGEFGSPVAYQDRTARRVLNRVFYSVARDTLWTLTQGDATIRGFTATGQPVGRPIPLPVYFRGTDPKVEIGQGHAGSDFLPNSMVYDPNVADVGVVHDSLFVTARYRDWGMKLVTGSSVSLRRMALSSLEVFDRRGRLRRAYDAPGMILAVETDGGSNVAIITRMRDNSRHVYVARLPR